MFNLIYKFLIFIIWPTFLLPILLFPVVAEAENQADLSSWTLVDLRKGMDNFLLNFNPMGLQKADAILSEVRAREEKLRLKITREVDVAKEFDQIYSNTKVNVPLVRISGKKDYSSETLLYGRYSLVLNFDIETDDSGIVDPVAPQLSSLIQ